MERKAFVLWTTINQLSQKLLREPTDAEIATELNWSVVKVAQTRYLGDPQTASLSAQTSNLGDNEAELSDMVPDPHAESGERWLIAHSTLRHILSERDRLNRLLDELHCSVTVRKVFRARYRLDEPGFMRRRMVDVGQVVGVSESRVSQVMQRVWFVIRRRDLARGLNDHWFRILPESNTAIAEVLGEDVVTAACGSRSSVT